MNRTPSLQRLALQALAIGLGTGFAQAAAPSSPQGLITGKAFLNISGTAVTALTGSPKYPNQPDVVMYPSYFEWNATEDIFTPPANNWNATDNYGTQIVGYFYPPTTGTYIFFLCADDNAALYLSTDEDPANKKLIAQETAWSNPREYFTSGGSSNLASKDSSQFTGTQWPTTDPGTGGAIITLQANRAYYIEAIAKEGGGGDNLSVAVQDPNFLIDLNLPIPGDYLSSDRANGPLAIVEQPQDQSADERGSTTFRVVADGTPPHSFQWRRNGEDIPDATGIAYTLDGVTVADNGAKYSVVITGAQGTQTSADATLTVVPDTVLPVLAGARGSASLTEVSLSFSEALDPTSAETVGNYQISSASGNLAVTGATLSPDGTLVTLTTAQQVLGTKYTILVSNVKDTAATPNTIAANSKAVFFPKGKLKEIDGMVVFEVENYDRNLDGIWVPDTTRGTPSGGVSMVAPNGAGGSESATQLQYDIEFSQEGTYVVWFRASGDNGNDDSGWFWIDGARPIERESGNAASMTGFQPNSDFVWRSDSQDGPDPFTVDVFGTGQHTIALARREDGSFFDKFILTTDTTFTPTGFGPPETRDGVPLAPTVALTGPTDGQEFTAGTPVVMTATASGDKGLEIVKVEFTANGTVVGEATSSPFTFTWTDAPEGIYAIQAVATDEIGVSTTSGESVVITVAGTPSSSSARIAWVSFHPADDTPSTDAANAGFTKASDAVYTEMLASEGHKVTRVITSGTPDAALLNAFDLVIISRAVPSGDYQDPPETLAWNGITAPTMILGGYVLRNSRLGYLVGGTIPDTVGPIRLTVNNPNHPIFEGIALGADNTMVNVYGDVVSFNNVVQRGLSVVTDEVAPGGTVLATVGTLDDPTFGGMVIGEWNAGATMANAAGDTLGGKRLVFLTGSRENDGLTSQGAGIYDLAEDGAKMFLNAVRYLTGKEPPPDVPTLAVSRSASGIAVTFTGTLESADAVSGPWTAVVGATSPYSAAADQAQRFYRARR